MTFAIIYDCIYPYTKGGVEKRIFEMTRRLNRTRQIHIFTMKFWNGEKLKKESNITYHGICRPFNLYSPSGKRRIYPAIHFSILLLFALFKQAPDILDCQNIPYIPSLACKLYCFIKKKPLVITWHEVWGNYWYRYLGWKGFFGKLIEKLTAKFSNYNIAGSYKTASRLQRISDKPITLIPLGVDIERIERTKPSLEQFDILFVGRLIPEKNVEMLIRIVAEIEIENVLCGIIGDGPFKRHLERVANERRVSDKIRFLGFVDDVYPYMKSSKIFVFPSVREGFGIVVIEANASGLPVVVLAHPNNAATELIKNGKNGFICKNEAEMTERTIQLLTDENLRKAQSRYARTSAEKYSWDKIVEEYERFITELV
ncbi:MAG: glycosyltransferase family 1 protein [Thermoprotei archaeon]|nr:MAG: glycosyltransferase family 1 protein [Thermoprotei archaeon]